MDFDIFKVRDMTKENEMITVATHLMQKGNLFEENKMHLETFLKFIGKIQSGYKDITYHNKTHASDLCQVRFIWENLDFLLFLHYW